MERKLATGGHDGRVSPTHYCSRDLVNKTFNLICNITAHPLSDSSCCSPGHHIFCACCLPLVTQVGLWDPKTGKPIGEPLKGHSKWITSLAWEPIHLYVYISFLIFVSRFRSPCSVAPSLSFNFPNLNLAAPDRRPLCHTLFSYSCLAHMIPTFRFLVSGQP